mmetsp:Transcript_11697/g.19751  ORF Transcript_11697/g.19751 Transcript_11697/m.19751 type:complete len:91 (+) Transcript_11697:345-617(+)
MNRNMGSSMGGGQQTDFIFKSFQLVSDFFPNLIQSLSENLKLSFLKKKKAADDTSDQQARSLAKWERLTHFMLNIDNMQNREGIPPRQVT